MKLLEYTGKDFAKLYRAIYKAGYQSAIAGDMWEPDVGPEDLAHKANNILDEWTLEFPKNIGSENVTSERLRQIRLKSRRQAQRIQQLESFLEHIQNGLTSLKR